MMVLTRSVDAELEFRSRPFDELAVLKLGQQRCLVVIKAVITPFTSMFNIRLLHLAGTKKDFMVST